MADAMNVVRLVQSQQMDPIQADAYFALMIEHIKAHIAFVSEDELNQQYVGAARASN